MEDKQELHWKVQAGWSTAAASINTNTIVPHSYCSYSIIDLKYLFVCIQYTYIYIHIHAFVYIHMFIRTHIYIYIHVYIYIYLYTYSFLFIKMILVTI